MDGGGLSGIQSNVSSDLLSKLSPQNRLKLQEYNNECLNNPDMTPFEMFTYLSKMFEELLAADCSANITGKDGGVSLNILHEALDYKAPEDHTITGMEGNKKLPEHLAAFYNEKDRLDREMLTKEINSTIEEVNQLELSPINDPYVEDLVSKIFCISIAHHNITFEDYLNSTTEMEALANMSNNEIVCCKICDINFATHQLYKKHVEHSDIHTQNVLDKKQKLFEKFKEGERLAKLAQSTVGLFYKSLHQDEDGQIVEKEAPSTSSYPPKLKASKSRRLSMTVKHLKTHAEAVERGDTTEEELPQRKHNLWKKAVGKVIAARLTHQYETLLDVLVVMPKDVKLLYNNVKYFFNIKAHFAFHFYLHCKQQILEVVPFVYLPFDEPVHVEEITEGNEAENTLQPVVDVEELAEKHIFPAKRIFLDYNSLLSLVMGNHKLDSIIAHNSIDNDSNTPSIPHTSGALVEVPVPQDTDLIKLLNDSIAVFVSNHLKTHNLTKKAKHLPMAQQNLHSTLYFDTEELVYSPLCSEQLPEGFVSVPVSEVKIFNQWKDKVTESTIHLPTASVTTTHE